MCCTLAFQSSSIRCNWTSCFACSITCHSDIRGSENYELHIGVIHSSTIFSPFCILVPLPFQSQTNVERVRLHLMYEYSVCNPHRSTSICLIRSLSILLHPYLTPLDPTPSLQLPYSALVLICTPCQPSLSINSFNTALTNRCCFNIPNPRNFSLTISIPYILPHPPLISCTSSSLGSSSSHSIS